jgi:glucose-6-phosphate dehydrogenase assembly protein OpcA
MATNYKVLGQAALTAETNTDVYTVPSATQAVVSTIVVCNRSATDNTFRIAIRPAGASLANQHYTAYDVTVSGTDSTNLTLGITLGAGDVVTAYAGAASEISVSVFGSEIS